MTAIASEPTITTTIASPLGPLTLTAAGDRLTGLHMHDQRHAPTRSGAWQRDDDAFAAVVEQLAAYFSGARTDFDVPLDLAGTEFQRRVWSQLREIPYGETVSYGELARRVGSPGASRAVGLANGRNPVAIIVPCHRVIGADGSLTGYGGGLDRKVWLLEHERAHLHSRRSPSTAPPLDGLKHRRRTLSADGRNALPSTLGRRREGHEAI